MPHVGPIKRNDLIRALRRAGFVGPEPGKKHAAMRLDQHTVAIPNPHRGDISRGLLARVLREAGITREEWENL